MPSESSNFIVCVLFFLPFVQMVIGDNFLAQLCSNTSGNYTPHSPYEQSLNKLLGQLRYKTPPTGFGMGSVGLSKNHTSGLSLCRGDISPNDCKTCVVKASADIRKSCPRNKAAVIWYDNCLLKYSNSNFLGKINFDDMFYMCGLNKVSDPKSFTSVTRNMLTDLSNTAYSDPKRYATGAINLGGSQKLYGLVQCTRDLSTANCKLCLLGTISELPGPCEGKDGGRIVGGSCYIRFEIYPIVGV